MSGHTLLVSLGELEVGHLWSDGTRSLFSFHEAYLDAPERRVLGQYFEDRLRKTARRVSGMHPWFENALPERSGVLRQRIAAGLGVSIEDSLSLLAALGDDLPGAVRVRSERSSPPPVDIVDEVIRDVAAQARFSLGGVQLKYSMSGEPSRLALGVTEPGGAQWILKLGTQEYPDLAENEHAIMTWCRHAGFDVPETHVVPSHTLPHLGAAPTAPTAFLVRRYDRSETGRTHQEDFAQVLNTPPSRKYDALDSAGLIALASQILGADGAVETLRRLVVVVATGNCDAHLKNWSLIYPDGYRPAWSPLYDQVATIAYPQLGKELSMRIGSAKHLHEVERRHLHFVAARGDLSPELADLHIDDTLDKLRATFSTAPLSDALRTTLIEHWARVPLLRDRSL